MSIIITISGGSGAGKTTFTNKLKELYKDDMTIVQYDSYCIDQSSLPIEELKKVNFDIPKAYDAKLICKHLKDLRKGKTIEAPIYDFTTHKRTTVTNTIRPSKIILIEGIMIAQVRQIRDLIDLSIYIDANEETRYKRRLERDVKERGRTPESVFDQYVSTVKPSHYKYIEPFKEKSDLVINNNSSNGVDEKEVEKITKKISELIKEYEKKSDE